MSASTLTWSVAALLKAVGDAVQARLGACSVRGEIGAFTRAASGHCYFTLKDETGSASVRCVMFRSAASGMGTAPADGARVDVRGRLAVYEPRGDLQLIVESLRLSGVGALYEEFLRRKARLEAEGLFDASRKQALPAMPFSVGILTSRSGAVVHDICTTLARRAPHLRVIVYPAPVQGRDAPAALVHSLAEAEARAEVDVLIVARGGGSIEDLWAFNDDGFVRALARCRLPIVSGVGHETDVTLCDLVADLRAPTPTAAAEIVSPATADLLARLSDRLDRLGRAVDDRLARDAQRLDRAAMRLGRPGQALRSEGARLQSAHGRMAGAWHRRHAQEAARGRLAAERLNSAGQSSTQRLRHDLAMLAVRMTGLDPRVVLERGYAWVRTPGGETLSSVDQVQVGQSLTVTLRDGSFTADATSVGARPAG